MATLNFKFLKDEPLNKDGDNFFSFYHAIIAPALLQILENETTPHTIGLFGSWGTGKSTIIRMLQDDPKLKIPIFIFDAWKYQNDALRRTFLIKFAEFVGNIEGVELDERILKPLYKSRSNSIAQEIRTTKAPNKKERFFSFLKAKSLPLTLSAALVAWILFNIIYRNNDVVAVLRQMSGTILGISFVAVLVKPAVEETIKHAVERFFGSLKHETELRTQTEYEERLNSPEQFEEKFKEIMAALNKKAVIVFDNIDRVPGDIAISMLSTIKTFMEPSKDGTAVFIVPCDAEAIERQIVEYYMPTQNEGSPSDNFTPSDYLRKVFNLVMWVPEFISTDLEQYTQKVLTASGGIKDLIDNEDVVLVINAAFSKNPREIIQFTNNLIALAVAAQESDVKDIINGNIAYLAKVLVLRQKFPNAYNRLKENWYRPEDVADISDGTASGLSDFMNLTSRITVSDAEPFIYFKNPDGSRGLRDSTALKAALVSGNLDAAIEAVKDETNRDAVADFIIDLVIKHKGQEGALQNIFITQFKLLASLKVEVKQKRYYENLVRVLDGQLWRKYRELPVDDVFKLLSNQLLNQKMRSVIVERYVVALQTKDDAKSYQDFDASVLDNFRLQPKLLSSQQAINVRDSIEKKYGVSEVILAMFRTIEDQERFVTQTTLQNYIATLDSANIARRILIVQQYKDFVTRQKLLESLVSKVAELLRTENTTNPAYSENKAQIVNALSIIHDTFGDDDLKALAAQMTELAEVLIQAFEGDGSWENRLLLAKELWRFIFDMPKEPQAQAITRIRTFLTNVPPEGMQQMLEYWQEHSRVGNFIHNMIDTLLPRILNNEQILSSVYQFANDKEKGQILTHLIENTPLDNPYDLNFIKQISVPDRIEIIKKLLERVGKFTYHQKASYYEYLADNLRRNDPRDIKDTALDQAKSLIKNDDPNYAAVGYDFIAHAKFLSDSDRRETAKEILNWLREPGRTADQRHRLAIKTATSAFGDLQKTPQADLVYLLFNMLDSAQSQSAIEVALEGLKETKPTYADYEKDYSDLLSRLQGWQDQGTKSYILNEIRSLQTRTPSTREKKFWSELDALSRQD